MQDTLIKNNEADMNSEKTEKVSISKEFEVEVLTKDLMRALNLLNSVVEKRNVIRNRWCVESGTENLLRRASATSGTKPALMKLVLHRAFLKRR